MGDQQTFLGICSNLFNTCILGIVDYVLPVNSRVWAHCMLTESIDEHQLCPENFTVNALYFGLTLDQVSHQNCVEAYLK